MKGKKILYIEDEFTLAEIVSESLTTAGFEVTHAGSGKTALEFYALTNPDLIVLDVMLPDMEGFEVARTIRVNDKKTPIIFLTSKSLPAHVVTGFESGGNDYLKKPFGIAELIVRIKALLSKDRLLVNVEEPADPVEFGTFIFHPGKGMLSRGDQYVQLTSREAVLLKTLLMNRNKVIERGYLLKSIWSADHFFAGRSLDVFITKLRNHLKPDPSVQIVNIRGVGYKLVY